MVDLATTFVVAAVSRDTAHNFSKFSQPSIRLIAGIGVEHDSHSGKTVQHLSRIAKNPNQPNLRQVHLIHEELLTTLCQSGFNVAAGSLGENILTRNLPLLDLPTGTRLHLGDNAIVELTGLRNPCGQLDKFQKGLLKAVLDRDPQGNLIRKAGVMGVVLSSGNVHPGDDIRVTLPAAPHSPLQPV